MQYKYEIGTIVVLRERLYQGEARVAGYRNGMYVLEFAMDHPELADVRFPFVGGREFRGLYAAEHQIEPVVEHDPAKQIWDDPIAASACGRGFLRKLYELRSNSEGTLPWVEKRFVRKEQRVGKYPKIHITYKEIYSMKNDKMTVEPGIRVTVKGRECDWGVGRVLMKNETIGQWMVKFEKCHDNLSTCNGIFDDKRYTWVAEEDMDILPGQDKADPRQNWSVLIQSVNGTVTSSVQFGEELCERTFHKDWNGMNMAQVAREWAEWEEKDLEYVKSMKRFMRKE